MINSILRSAYEQTFLTEEQKNAIGVKSSEPIFIYSVHRHPGHFENWVIEIMRPIFDVRINVEWSEKE